MKTRQLTLALAAVFAAAPSAEPRDPEYDYVPHAKRLSVTLDVSCVPASGRLERGA